MENELAISIRKATPEDAQAMIDIKVTCVNRIYKEVNSETVINKWISLIKPEAYLKKIKSSYWLYVATIPSENSDKVVGFGFLNTNTRRPQPIPDKYDCKIQLELLYIDPNYHRQGIGRRILEALEQTALNEGYTRIGVLASLPGVSFYSRQGFAVKEECVHYDIVKETFTPGEYSIVTAVMCKDLHSNHLTYIARI